MKKKVLKRTIIGILVIIIAYAILVAVDYFRLKSTVMYSKPLITISKLTEQDGAVYSGIGYSVKYHTTFKTIEKNGTEMRAPVGCDATFRLFGMKIGSWTDDSITLN